MKKAIQAKRRTPPAGFEARSDMQILKLTAETKPGRRMPRAAVILCVILAVVGLATPLAATVDMVWRPRWIWSIQGCTPSGRKRRNS